MAADDDDDNVPESAKMEEGIAVSEPAAEHPSPASSATANNEPSKRLSTVSRMYNVSGTGALDEAELAMRNMDQTGRGYLTNDKVYALMQEQIKLQKNVFQMKKLIIGLLVFIVVLALSNLGTSFASAILAKDTTTNDKNELADKDTGEAVATQTTADTYDVMPVDPEADARKLELCTNGANIECDLSSLTEYKVPSDVGKKMCLKCSANKNVQIRRPFDDGSASFITLCSSGDNDGNYGPGGSYCHLKNGVSIDDGDGDGFATIKGDKFTLDDGETCTSDGQCDEGLSCLVPSGVATGTCGVALGNGASCAFDDQCDDGLYCQVPAGICSQTLGEGATCAADSQCNDGFICPVPAGESTGLCSRALGEGGTCQADSHCGDGLYCDFLQGVGDAMPEPLTEHQCHPAFVNENCTGFGDNPYCAVNSDGWNVCSMCHPVTNDGCDEESVHPRCIELGHGYECGCNVYGGADTGCTDPESCAAHPCISPEGAAPFCSTDHYADALAAGDCYRRTKALAQTGTCSWTSVWTSVCTEQYDPVCGVDGKTYDNDCKRKEADITKDHDGECAVALCLTISEPVCGLDGNTYSNECVMNAEGVEKDYDGECSGGGTADPI